MHRRDLFRNVLIKWDRSWWLGWGSRSFSLQPLTIYFDSHSGLRKIRCRTFKVLLAVRSSKTFSLLCNFPHLFPPLPHYRQQLPQQPPCVIPREALPSLILHFSMDRACSMFYSGPTIKRNGPSTKFPNEKKFGRDVSSLFTRRFSSRRRSLILCALFRWAALR